MLGFFDVLEKNRQDENKLKQVVEDYENLKYFSDNLKEKKEVEKPFFDEQNAHLEKMIQEYYELLKNKGMAIKEKQELVQQQKQMEKAILQAVEDIKKMGEQNQKEKHKIVRSPLKIKDQYYQTEKDLENVQNSLKELNQVIQMLQFKIDIYQNIISKFKKSCFLPAQKINETAKKDIETKKICKQLKNEHKELQSDLLRKNDEFQVFFFQKKKKKKKKVQKYFFYFLQILNQKEGEIIQQLEKKQKNNKEKTKYYEEELKILVQEQNKLEQEKNYLTQSQQEIQIMRNNLEYTLNEELRNHHEFMSDKQIQMTYLINGFKEYKQNIFLMLDELENQ
ncbi:hypothetical protein IMG5_132960 [Ichthyophthirius multifiliis]|uniref:Uncharacterized protein n=1 Tax=Ichthyophthirius multifiliis TaxID=5932 RepID=G0QWK2_ICHMU|nr:hypothetical protein IMG5_132960 [Ichthyophthirius multifiliis]EGR30397.1 hypothetical protein IMG5_132960 [Ichthyophthirius multifiliis]|eukprot:XP_004031984.1 hypothetical protein IMG5_132960 [Ichthyophthirius multifiliis]